MTKESLISANTMDRDTNEYLPAGGDTLAKDDATPVVGRCESEPVAGEWNENHTFVADFRLPRPLVRGSTMNPSMPTRSNNFPESVFDEHTGCFAPENVAYPNAPRHHVQ